MLINWIAFLTKNEAFFDRFKYPGLVKALKAKNIKTNENAAVMTPNQTEHKSLWTINMLDIVLYMAILSI
jgi:hypothetical protein